ncbi:MAG: putative Na+/H+ antiporter [Steroidobacteraceae bacterium]
MEAIPPVTIAEALATALFALAIMHTFATRAFEHLAHLRPAHAGLWHLLGEVEVVFGVWALALVAALFALQGPTSTIAYVESRDFTEPLFVFVIMVIAGSRPVLLVARAAVEAVARRLPLAAAAADYFVTLALVPLLGSLITEPAAMTVAALMLGERHFAGGAPVRLRYATLAVLFVNVSVGGTLTPFAAPPVLMVADTWGWDFAFMLGNFGWKAAIAVAVNAAVATALFRDELGARGQGTVAAAAPVDDGTAYRHDRGDSSPNDPRGDVPLTLTLVHLAFLAGVVASAHHPALFLGLFLVFLGVAQAYERHQDPLMLREGLLVACFLAGLVVLGGLQRWWLQPLLVDMGADVVFYGALALTAFTDNAALTYLGSLVPDLSADFRYSLVAGAVAGGGLTIIANAPNPAGIAILRRHFEDGAVKPLWLALAALPPTLVAALALRLP